MVRYGSRDLAEKTRGITTVANDVYYKSVWMESGDDPTLSPTVFMIEQPAGATLDPHFHKNNQFQLFVEGAGRIGGHGIDGVTVHYAGAYTGYGPIASSSPGLKYLTLRPVWETGSYSISESKEHMRRGPKRGGNGKVSVRGNAYTRFLLGVEFEQIIPPGPDGLGALAMRLPPFITAPIPTIPGAQGQFIVVLGGAANAAGHSLREWESLYLSADETPPAFAAGADGAEIVILSIPPKHENYR